MDHYYISLEICTKHPLLSKKSGTESYETTVHSYREKVFGGSVSSNLSAFL